MSTKPANGTALNTSNAIEQTLAVWCAMLEGSGSFADLIQSQAHALSSGAAWASGSFGPQLQNTGGGISAAAALTTPVSAPYSVTWIGQLTNSGLVCASGWANPGTDAYSGLYQSGTTVGVLNSSGGFGASWTISAGLLGTFAVLTVTLSGTAAGSTAILYVNGASQGSVTTTGTISAPSYLSVGISPAGSFPWEAPVLGVAVHNGALTSGQAGTIGTSLLGLYGQAFLIASFTVDLATVPPGEASPITLSLTGTGTSWTSGSTVTVQNSVTGATAVTKGTWTATSSTAAALTITTGSGTGTFTITIDGVVSGALAVSNTYAVTQSGNWSSPATWGNAYPPIAGCTVTNTSNYALTVDVNATCGLASFTTGGTPAFTFDSGTNGASLTIAAGVTLTLIGDLHFATNTFPDASTITQDAGSSIVFDPPSGQQCAIGYGNQQSFWNINGTSGSRCTLTTNLSSGGLATVTTLGASRQQGVTSATYCDFSNLGTSTGWGLQITDGGNDSQDVSIAHCTFTACSLFNQFTPTFAHAFTFSNNTCQNNTPVTAYSTWLYSQFQNAPTGGRTFSGNVFKGTVAASQIPIWLYQQGCTVGPMNYFDDWGSATSAIEHPSWAYFKGNFVRKQNTGEGEFGGDVGVGGGNYLFMDSGAGTAAILVTDYQDFTIGNNVFDVSYAGTGGACVVLTEASTGVRSDSWIVNNIQTVPAPGVTWFPWDAVTNSTPTNPINVSFEHNTAPVGGAASSPVQINGSGGGERTGGVASIRSNLFWGTGTPTVPAVLNTVGTGAVADAVAAAKIGHNAFSNCTTQAANYWTTSANPTGAPVSGATTCSDGTAYDSPMSGSTAPGSGDINYGTISSATTQGPKFVDPTRWLGAWAVHKGYTASGTASVQVAAALSAIQGDLTLIADALAWVRGGFVPADSALIGSSYTGDTSTADAAGNAWPTGVPGRGAMGVQSGSATAYTLTASASKGNCGAGVTLTATLNGDPSGAVHVTLTPSGCGLSTPVVLTFSGSTTVQAATFTPPLIGTLTVAPTNDGGLTNPSAVTYLSMVATGSSGTAPSGNACPQFGGFDFYANGPWLPEFKRDITGDAVDPGSVAYLSQFGSAKLHVDFSATGAGGGTGTYGIPVNVVPGTQANVAISYTTYASWSNAGTSVPIPPNGSFEGYYNSGGGPPPSSPTGDGHCLVAVRNETTGLIDTLYEFYKLYSTDGGTTWVAAGGWKFDIATGAELPDGQPTAEAAGTLILPPLLTYERVHLVLQGLLPDLGHTVRATFPGDNRYVWPARNTANSGGAYPSGGGLPDGARVRLSSAWMAANRSNYSGQAGVIIDAMHKYGLINSDTGASFGAGIFVEGVTDDNWDPDNTTHGIFAIGNIPCAAFEVVSLRPAWTWSGPSSGIVGVPKTFTISRSPATDTNFDSNVYLYRTDVGGSQVGFSPQFVTLDDAQPTTTFTFTPPSAGAYSLVGNQGNEVWWLAAPLAFEAIPPSFVVSPPTIRPSNASSTTLVLTGTGTTWTSGSTVTIQNSVAGTTDVIRGTWTATSGTAATLTVTTGAGTGVYTITVDGVASPPLAVSNFSPARWFPGLSRHRRFAR